MEKNKTWDSSIDIMRVFFLLSIIAAHSAVTSEEVTGKLAEIIWEIWQVWSCVGVPGFLILSGYLFKGKQEQFLPMLQKKMRSIVVPWLVCGTLVYFICNYPELGVQEMLQFIAGYYSYLYYIPILLVCFFIFYLLADKSGFLLGCIVINILSLYFTQCGIYHALFTDFLNIMNWIGYFSVGCLLRKYNVLIRIKFQSRAMRYMIIILALSIFVIAVASGVENYFCWIMFVAGIGTMLSIYCLCCFETIKKIPYLPQIGRWAYTIYLLHMPFVAAIKRVVRWIFPGLYIMIPVVIILIFSLVLSSIQRLSNRRILFKYVMKIIGMR